jgi:hypothetical protein
LGVQTANPAGLFLEEQVQRDQEHKNGESFAERGSGHLLRPSASEIAIHQSLSYAHLRSNLSSNVTIP